MFKIKHYIIVVLTIGFSFLNLTVNAQTETATSTGDIKSTSANTAAEKSAKKGAEKITVTGSHIKRIQIEGPTPVQVLDREHLDKTGYNSVSDVLRDVTASTFGGSRETAGSQVADVATVNLRGLGASKTLVLMNGRRLPKDSIGAAVDLNNIPFDAVERIEILKDGASALYGSDAVGGVVNIITKKDFEGLSFSTSGVFNSTDFGERFAAGSRLSGSATYGFANDKLNLVTVVNYRKNEGLFSRERDYTNFGESPTSSRPSFSTDNRATWNTPGCPVSEQFSNGRCKFNYAEFSQALPSIEQYSLMSEGAVHLTPVMDLIVRGSFTHKKTNYVFAPAPGTFNTDGPGGGPNYVAYRFMELGNRYSDFATNAGSLLVGVKTEVFSDWEVTSDISYNIIDRKEEKGGAADRAAIETLIFNGGIDLSQPAGSRIINQAGFDAAKLNPFQKTKSTLLTVNALATGELTDDLSLALGTSFSRDDYKVRVDEASERGAVFGAAQGSNSGGDRSVISAYAELGYMPLDTLEFQFAARFDNYDDFGSTVNPKIAARFQPSSKLLIRSSAGTGFKAPDLQDLYGNGSSGFSTFIDRVYCDTSGNGPSSDECKPSQYYTESPTNKSLEEEKFWSANLGAVYQINKDHSIGLDVFYLNMNNVVDVDYEAITQAELDGIDIEKYGIKTSRTPGTDRLITGTGEGLFAPTLNLGSLEQYGLDLTLDNKLRLPEDNGLIEVKTNVSYVLAYEYEKFPGLGKEGILLEAGQPRWRANLAVTHIPVKLPLTTSLLTRVIGDHECAVKEICHRKPYAEIDIQGVYRSKVGDVTVGVQNLLNTTAPLDSSDINNQFDDSLYNTRGQTIYLGYKYTF